MNKPIHIRVLSWADQGMVLLAKKDHNDFYFFHHHVQNVVNVKKEGI